MVPPILPKLLRLSMELLILPTRYHVSIYPNHSLVFTYITIALVFHKSPVLRGRNRSHTVSKPGLLSALLSGELRHGLDGDMAATTFNLNALKEEKEKKEQEKKE